MFLGASYLEWAANILTALCIFLAGRNKVLTWPVGIVATVLFGALFYQAKLYADVTLQVFFVITGMIGWINWKDRALVKEVPTYANRRNLIAYVCLAITVAGGYGAILYHYTDAWAPFIDSGVLTLSILGQFLLMRKHIQTWAVWLVVNTLSVPLYISRDLYLTAFMYSLFWVNAIVSWYYWNKLMEKSNEKV